MEERKTVVAKKPLVVVVGSIKGLMRKKGLVGMAYCGLTGWKATISSAKSLLFEIRIVLSIWGWMFENGCNAGGLTTG